MRQKENLGKRSIAFARAYLVNLSHGTSFSLS